MTRSITTAAIVMKRSNVGELDRVVTLLTREEGKLAVVAKGVRQLKSSQRAYLEPGNQVQVMLVKTHGLPIVTQTKLMADTASARATLISTKRLWEVLEMVDRMTPEGERDPQLYDQVARIMALLTQPGQHFRIVQTALDELIQYSGYPSLKDTPYTTLTEYVQMLADRPLKSYDYLTVKPKSREG